MTPLDVRLDMHRRPWDDVDTAQDVTLMRIGFHPEATSGGRPAVAFLFTDQSGQSYIAWTTYRLLRAAVRGMQATPAGLIEEEEIW